MSDRSLTHSRNHRAHGMPGRRRTKWLAGAVALPAALAVTTGTTAAQASQPEGGPYAPVSAEGGQTVEAWAFMDDSCPTARCDTYLKIERYVGGLFGDGWEDVVGGWISRQDGWVSVSGVLPEECGTYRAVVEDYVLERVDSGSVSASRGGMTVSQPVSTEEEYTLHPYYSDEVTLCGERISNHPTF